MKRKLIEVSLPLEAINKQAAREKSIRHGHPSTLHLWWARRPLAAARAVLFAQLVDDPSARPDEFPTPEGQQRERERLHRIVERLVDWDNVRDDNLLAQARAEILKSTGDTPPTILDPFAGGGTIPLEAQRLGLDAQASDLNPVAVLINKALIEIPSRFRGMAPVFPGLAGAQIRSWAGAEGLAADVREYGQWMRDRAEQQLGALYPQVGGMTVIAWIWARTIACPNPACGIEMPLVRSWWLGKKRGKQAYVVPIVVPDESQPAGKRVEFTIGTDGRSAPSSATDGTVGRQGATCVACGSATDLKVVRAIAASGGLGRQLMAIVAEGNRQRVYLAPTNEHAEIADSVRPPDDAPAAELPKQALGFRVQAYGFTKWVDLFTPRQLRSLVTFSDLVGHAREKVISDGGSEDYADAVATFLGFGVSKATDYHNALCAWRSDVKNEGIGHLFSRQAIPMVWDYCEANPLSSSSGNMRDQWTWVAKSLEFLVPSGAGAVYQADAATRSYDGVVVSTDPPYYDNIDYSDLSDFFYVWLRRSLRTIYPDLLSTLLVPKDEELVANPFRHNGPDGAKEFFESGFRSVFTRARAAADPRFPITVYYAFKQTESEAGGEASTGWETLLEGMIQSGWVITSTWPLRSELGNRMRSIGSNALASSIVLSLRPRPEDARVIDRRGYLDLLRDELPPALADLQRAAIAPVDLAQAAIGPGMALFSRYARVVEPTGTSVTVREALRLINAVLGEVLSDQEGDFDKDTRWCVKWFETHGFNKASYGEAETLASAYNTSVAGLDRSGAVYAKAGEVRVLTTAELPTAYRPERDEHITLWEVAMHLAKALDESGLAEAGRILDGAAMRVDVEAVKELAYLVFSLAEKRSMVQVAGMFNALVTSWPEVTAAAKAHASAAPKATEQAMLVLDEEFGD